MYFLLFHFKQNVILKRINKIEKYFEFCENIIKTKFHKQNGTLKSFMQIRLNCLLLNILCTLLIALDFLKDSYLLFTSQRNMLKAFFVRSTKMMTLLKESFLLIILHKCISVVRFSYLYIYNFWQQYGIKHRCCSLVYRR